MLLLRKIVIVSIILASFDIVGQTRDSLGKNNSDLFLFSRRNSLNFEIFGHGLFYSLSYERILINDFHFKFAGQGGISVYPYAEQIDIWLPISINYIKAFGLKLKHHAEIGFGHVARYDQYYNGLLRDPWQTFITAKAGYRYQKPAGRWIFKILITPFYEYDRKNIRSIAKPSLSNALHDSNPYPSGAISIGYTF